MGNYNNYKVSFKITLNDNEVNALENELLEKDSVRDLDIELIEDKKIVLFGINVKERGIETRWKRYTTIESLAEAEAIYKVLSMPNERNYWQDVEIEEIRDEYNTGDIEYTTIKTTLNRR